MTQQDKSRAVFEAACSQWKEDAGHESYLSFAIDKDGFLDKQTQALMQLWQAAIAHERNRIMFRLRDRQIAGAILTSDVKEIVMDTAQAIAHAQQGPLCECKRMTAAVVEVESEL